MWWYPWVLSADYRRNPGCIPEAKYNYFGLYRQAFSVWHLLLVCLDLSVSSSLLWSSRDRVYMHFRDVFLELSHYTSYFQSRMQRLAMFSFYSYNLVTQKMAKILYTKKCQEYSVNFNLRLETVDHSLALV